MVGALGWTGAGWETGGGGVLGLGLAALLGLFFAGFFATFFTAFFAGFLAAFFFAGLRTGLCFAGFFAFFFAFATCISFQFYLLNHCIWGDLLYAAAPCQAQ